LDVWADGVVAAYQDDWCAAAGTCADNQGLPNQGRIVVDWNVSWTNPSPFTFNKFLVRWDVNGIHHDDGNPCERGDGDQCDVLADMTAVQAVLLHYYNDTHLYTKGTFTVTTNHGDGDYRISVKGCNEGSGPFGGDACQPDWMHPVVVTFKHQPHAEKTFSPLQAILPEHTSPEMLYLEVKWSSLLPYQVGCDLLHDVLPVNEKISAHRGPGVEGTPHALGPWVAACARALRVANSSGPDGVIHRIPAVSRLRGLTGIHSPILSATV
jgi:hypothetical protein